MQTIWLVTGSTGEYEDVREWVVAAYPNEELAQAHCKLANEKAKEAYPGEDFNFKHEEKFIKIMKKLDPKAKMDYTGTFYSCEKVSFRADLPR
jgi:hypothetical protein